MTMQCGGRSFRRVGYLFTRVGIRQLFDPACADSHNLIYEFKRANLNVAAVTRYNPTLTRSRIGI